MGALIFKYADLNPPLGMAGGPCRVVDRILREKLPPGERDKLVSLVDADEDLSNPQAHEVYDTITERGPAPFNQFVLTPHSQYRMDLRSVTVGDLRQALSRFVDQIEDWKRKRDPRVQQMFSGAKEFEWVDPKSGLFFAFGLGKHGDTPAIITTYWKNKKTPAAPAGGCQIRSAYQAPVGDLFGVRTVTDEKPAKGIWEQGGLGDTIEHPPGETWKSDRDRAIPETTDNNHDLTENRAGPPVFNTPGPATKGEPPSPIPKSKLHMRTPSTPGEEYGHPYKENIYPRRTAEEHEAAGAGTFPTYDERQHKQQGEAQRYYKKWYRRNKNKIQMRARRRYKTERNSPSFKRRKHLINTPKYHNRFRRLPANGVRTLGERAKKDREEREKTAAVFPMSFYIASLGSGDILDFDPEGVLVCLDGEVGGLVVVPIRVFLREVVFDNETDLEAFFSAFEEAYGTPDPRAIAATFYREVYQVGRNMDPGPGAQDLGLPSQYSPTRSLQYPDTNHDQESRPPGHKLDIREMDQAPGSAKVIPSGHDFVNKEASSIRVASAIRVAKRLAELLDETSTDVLIRAKGIRPKGRRFDQKTGMYMFSVPGSTGDTYVVRMKVMRKGNATKLRGMELRISCSCDFWRWQGPEHWASVGDYLYGTPRGTASVPNIKDPRAVHRVCKHVAAVLTLAKKWELPSTSEE